MAFGITLNDIPCNYAQCNGFVPATTGGQTVYGAGAGSLLGVGQPTCRTSPPVNLDFTVAWTAQPSNSLRFDFDLNRPITGPTAGSLLGFGTASVVNKAQGAFQVGWASPVFGPAVHVTFRLVSANLNFNFTALYAPPNSHNVNLDFVSDISVTPPGAAISVSLGNVSIGLNANVTPAGVQLSTALGSVGVRLSPNVQPSGVQADVALGQVSTTSSANVAVSGVQTSVALGTVSTRSDVDAHVSGVQLGVALGDVELHYDYAYTPDGVLVPIALGRAIGLPNTMARPAGVVVPVRVNNGRVSGIVNLHTLVPDPERLMTVLRDPRVSTVPPENRLARVLDDPRVSDILPDNRAAGVPAESRSAGVPLSDRSLILPA